MATTNIQLNVGGRTFTKPKAYSSVIDRDFEVNHSQDADDYMTIYTSSSGLGVTSLQSLKCFCLYNKSNVGVEIQIQNQDWKNDSNIDVDNSVDVSGAGASNDRFHTFILAAGDFFYSSTGKFIDYYKGTESAANAAALNNRVPDDNDTTPELYIDSTANVDAGGIVSSTSETTINVEPWTSAANNSTNLFYVGDLIRVDDEIMEVTAIGNKSDLDKNILDEQINE